MKTEKRLAACELRKQGISINKIAKKLCVSKGSVSTWVREIILTADQLEILKQSNPIFNNQLSGNKIKSQKARQLRLEYQKEGRIKAKENNMLHQAGCMLYWAEGAKDRRSCKFSNSDPNMLKLFLKFLVECYNIQQEKIRVHINCYTNNGLTVLDIEQYWQNILDLPKSCFTKTTTDNLSKYSSNKKSKNKLLYGTVSIDVHSVKLIQNIYGAIQTYAGFDCEYNVD